MLRKPLCVLLKLVQVNDLAIQNRCIQKMATIERTLEMITIELGKALQARYRKAELTLVKESIQECCVIGKKILQKN